jgi:hypothetical protein
VYFTADKRVVAFAAGGMCSSVSIPAVAKCFPVCGLFSHAKQPQPGAIFEAGTMLQLYLDCWKLTKN